MRLALLIAITTAAGLGACAPVPTASSYPYGYTAAPAPVTPYGYYDGGYAPGPYYAEPAYGYAPPYVSPGPTIIVGGERRFNDRDRDRYRYERPRYDGGFRGNQPPPNRDFERGPGPQNFGGGRPGPSPVAMSRPPPPPTAPPPSPQPSYQPSYQPPGGPLAHSPTFNPANPTAQGDRQ